MKQSFVFQSGCAALSLSLSINDYFSCFLAAMFTFRKFYVPLVKKIIETISIEIKVGLEEFKSKCVLLSGDRKGGGTFCKRTNQLTSSNPDAFKIVLLVNTRRMVFCLA